MEVTWSEVFTKLRENPALEDGWCGMGKEEFIEAFERSVQRMQAAGKMNNLRYLKALYDIKRMKNGECTFLNLDK